METDYDNLIGFWIKGAPYLWVQGETPYKSKRFYMLFDIAVFDQKDYILDSNEIRIYSAKEKIDLAETFSLLPFPKEKECQMVRDYFLVWTFSFLSESARLKFSYDNGIVFPWTDKADIRIEGKKIGEEGPDNTKLIGLGGTLEIINHNPPFHRKITIFPGVFGNHFASSEPNWIGGGRIEYYPETREYIGYNNITEVQQLYGESENELRDIHIRALYNLLAKLYINLKKEEEYPPIKREIIRRIGYVIEELEELGENPRKDEELRYGWIYSVPDMPTIRILYDMARGKKKAYQIRHILTEKIYPAPIFCYISVGMKGWIGKDKYYQDRKRKWGFDIDDDGYQELCMLSHEVQKLLDANMRMMETKYSDYNEVDRIIREGVEIYDRKPAFKTGVTWSQGDYSHLGLQREYLRYKSIQRFTETWEMLRSANNLGLLRNITDDHTPRTIRVCSMAGGPGFELYAIQRFFHRYYPYIKVTGASLDLEESWEPYVKLLEFRFRPWNTSDGKNFISKCGGKIDLAIVSYSLHMYMSGDEHIKWLSDQIRSGEIPLLFVNSRMKNLQKHKDRMAARGVVTTPLLNQSKRRDDRQMVYHLPKLRLKPPSLKIEVMFPNVPFT